MDTRKIAAQLEVLLALDANLYHAYADALLTVDAPEVRNRLISFKADHEKHVTEYSHVFEQLSGKPFRHLSVPKWDAVGTERALKSLRAQEKALIEKYEGILSLAMAPDLKELLRRTRDDERRHLKYLDRCIEQSVWEPSEMKIA